MATDERTLTESRFAVDEVVDPGEIARFRAQDDRARRNSAWLESHWADVLPRARGKFLAVAGQEAFIAESPEAAWAMAEAAHPEDSGAFVQYVRPERGPRLYAHRR